MEHENLNQESTQLGVGVVIGKSLDLNAEWKKFITKVNPEKWSSSEETCYYLAFCTGWWARTGEASFQNDR